MDIGFYNKRSLDHFANPRNVGKMDLADGTGLAGDPSCGDYVKVYIKIEGALLADIKYEVHGCPAAIATTSAFSELVKGRLLEEAQLIGARDVEDALGGLPGDKIHCSCMAVEAFNSAILDWMLTDSDKLLTDC
jgi:nitrogen fixation NifU-like protein